MFDCKAVDNGYRRLFVSLAGVLLRWGGRGGVGIGGKCHLSLL
ncbi:hypothetical protein CCP3SC1AL1_4780002 [Gammaproteobacteria bacterium]